MTFKVTIRNSQQTFYTKFGQTILDSALAANLNIPYSCKSGNCGMCKCNKISGEIAHGEYSSFVLSANEVAANKILLCKSVAKSDIVIDTPDWSDEIPLRLMHAKIEAITKTPSVAILKLKLLANQSLHFHAGQYINILYKDKIRSYSLASSPMQPCSLELHIRYYRGGVFSEVVWNDFIAGKIIRFKGPLGNFTLQDNVRNHSILMICTGTGFAPIKSILEYMVSTNDKRTICLI